MESGLHLTDLQTESDSSATRPPRANILGVKIDAVDMASALRRIESALAENRKGYVCAPDAYNIMCAQDDPEQRRILNNSLLTIADSRAVVWTAWAYGIRQLRQVGGPELMLEMCRVSQTRGYRHFFYGGEPGVAEELRKLLELRFPGLNVVGTYTPPFRPLTDAECDDLIGLVATLKPDLFWVGISSPKQERFMAEYLPLLDTKLMFAVGAAFNFHTGRVRFSPHWMQLAGLSWLFRLTQEPKRLWRRYFFAIPRFLWGVGLQLLGLRRYPLR
jgi:N-acetylglucosaminyldiphosphoundecaprenol N-acetyl-beta-D-mannosaminyltransferase